MEMLAIIGYQGLPSKEKLDAKLLIMKYLSVGEWSLSLKWIFKWNTCNMQFWNIIFFVETSLLEGKSPLYLDFWINELKCGLHGRDIFHNFPERSGIPPPSFVPGRILARALFKGSYLCKIQWKWFENIEVIGILTWLVFDFDLGYVLGFLIGRLRGHLFWVLSYK